ncbi:MAG TPA: alkaline phosphatase family protein [Terrimesophilobacter sp.]|nr:alkaline phosphatase family protein [Terrimesophilobacter sp.]
MLPATKSGRPSLADVLPSCLAAIFGEPNSLALPSVDRAVVVLVDGLGVSSLRARAGHARTMVRALTKASVATAGFPTTTAANLATLTTGEPPGIHGLIGYTVLDPAHDRIVNQLTGWDDRLDPATWQRAATVFERASHLGVPSIVVAQERYRHSGFTHAVLRGARYVSGKSIADRFAAARQALDDVRQGIVYLYIPELDQAAHAHGWESEKWRDALEAVDSELSRFVPMLGPREGMLVTADHGVIDVPESSHVLFGDDSALVDGIRFVAGEPRCLQLHFEPDAGTPLRASILERWNAAEGGRSHVLTRREAIEQGWFGPAVDPVVAPRIGDILVAARRAIAYYDTRAQNQTGRNMIGQHGSFSPEESAVPLLRFGAFGLSGN